MMSAHPVLGCKILLIQCTLIVEGSSTKNGLPNPIPAYSHASLLIIPVQWFCEDDRLFKKMFTSSRCNGVLEASVREH